MNTILKNKNNVLSENSKPLTIAMFSDTYPPDINGVAVAVQTLKKSLESAGHTVYIITPTEDTKFKGKIFVDEDNVIRIPGIRIKKLYGYRISRPVSLSAYKLLGSLGIDVCHVHTEFSMRFIASAFCKGKKIPLIYTYHTMYEDYTHYVTNGHFNSAARRLVRWLVYLYAHGTSALIAPTEKTKEALLSYNIENEIFVIPSGINTEALKRSNFSEKQIAALRSNYGLEDKFVIVYLGRIAEEKNIDLLIRAMPKIKQTIKNAVLLVVGYGPQEERLKAQAESLNLSDCVIFTGKVNHSEIGLYYAMGNVFASASTSETQGLTYIEAMAASLPVIAMKDKCLDGVLFDGVNGYLFENEDDYCEKICKFASLDQKAVESMRNEALNMAKSYSFEQTAEKISSVYKLYLNSDAKIKLEK